MNNTLLNGSLSWHPGPASGLIVVIWLEYPVRAHIISSGLYSAVAHLLMHLFCGGAVAQTLRLVLYEVALEQLHHVRHLDRVIRDDTRERNLLLLWKGGGRWETGNCKLISAVDALAHSAHEGASRAADGASTNSRHMTKWSWAATTSTSMFSIPSITDAPQSSWPRSAKSPM